MAGAKQRNTPSPEALGPPVSTSLAVVVLGTALSLLAVFQWSELLVSLAGGEIACSIDERFNCAQVWTSPFAVRVHSLSGMPVAGWGLVYGLTVFGLALLLIRAALLGRPWAAAAHALRVVAGAGVLTCVGLFLVTAQLGTYCLTCLATYALVAALAVAALRLRPGPSLGSVGLPKILAPALGLAAASYLLLLWPALRTPHERVVDLGTKKVPPAGPAAVPPAPPLADPLSDFVANLPISAQQAVADGLLSLKNAQIPPSSSYASRQVYGPANTPLRFVDFSDLRCGHCKYLAEILTQLEEEAPGGFSHESRFFPLDGGCNPKVPPTMVDPSHVRCDGAKALICLEGKQGALVVRQAVFAEQTTITMDRIFQLAKEKANVDRPALEACIQSPGTASKLAEDIEYASRYNIDGTPLLLVNGRSAPPMAPLLYALILARGDLSAPGFSRLPPGRSQPPPH